MFLFCGCFHIGKVASGLPEEDHGLRGMKKHENARIRSVELFMYAGERVNTMSHLNILALAAMQHNVDSHNRMIYRRPCNELTAYIGRVHVVQS